MDMQVMDRSSGNFSVVVAEIVALWLAVYRFASLASVRSTKRLFH